MFWVKINTYLTPENGIPALPPQSVLRLDPLDDVFERILIPAEYKVVSLVSFKEVMVIFREKIPPTV